MKKKIKIYLSNIPFGIGRYLMQPMLFIINKIYKVLQKEKQLLFIYFKNIRLNRTKNKKISKFYFNESNRIKNSIIKNYKIYSIVYDDYVSPPTYGDFLYVLMLVRYLNANNLKVNFYIINSEKNPNIAFLGTNEAQKFITERVELARTVINPELSNIKILTWSEYSEQKKIKNNLNYTIFSNLVASRMPIYNHSFNLLSCLLRTATDKVIKATLLSKDSIFIKNKIRIPENLQKKYSVINCRYNPRWRETSNLSNLEFYKVGIFIKENFPSEYFIITSNKEGCDYYKELCHMYGFNFLFSSDFANGFTNSLQLVLNSRCMIQFKGGGIGAVGVLSELPYYFNTNVIHEIMYKKNKIASWSSKKQIFLNSSDFLLNPYSLKRIIKKSK